MSTERILDKIWYIKTHSKNSRRVREEITTVMGELDKIHDFSRRDFLEEKLTEACCN